MLPEPSSVIRGQLLRLKEKNVEGFERKACNLLATGIDKIIIVEAAGLLAPGGELCAVDKSATMTESRLW